MFFTLKAFNIISANSRRHVFLRNCVYATHMRRSINGRASVCVIVLFLRRPQCQASGLWVPGGTHTHTRVRLRQIASATNTSVILSRSVKVKPSCQLCLVCMRACASVTVAACRSDGSMCVFMCGVLQTRQNASSSCLCA